MTDVPIAAALLGLIVAAVALVVRMAATEKAKKAWQDIALRLGLDLEVDSKMSGTLEGKWVEASVYTKGHGKSRRTYTQVRVKGGMPKDVQLAREGFWSMVAGGDVPTGDRRFDADVKVTGNPTRIQALLDPAMREALHEPIRDGWRLEEGTLNHEVQGRLGAEVEERILAGVTLAKVISAAAGDLPSRLAARLETEREAVARRTVFKILEGEYKHTPAYPRALTLALGDADPELRFMAAMAATDLTVLLELAVDPSVGSSLRADALRNLSGHAGEARELAAAVDALRAERATAPSFPKALMVALCAAHTEVARDDTEAFLINALDEVGDVDEDVQVAAITALAKVGTVAAVPVLTGFRDRAFASVRRVPSAAKDAILAIQARIAGIGAGALSIAEGGGAELALVDDEAGTRAEANREAEREFQRELETAG